MMDFKINFISFYSAHHFSLQFGKNEMKPAVFSLSECEFIQFHFFPLDSISFHFTSLTIKYPDTNIFISCLILEMVLKQDKTNNEMQDRTLKFYEFNYCTPKV